MGKRYNVWNRQDLGKTYLLLLAEPFLEKTSGKNKAELKNLPNSTLYRHLSHLEQLGLYFKKKEKLPSEFNFYQGLLNTMAKRRVPGTPNPFGFLHALYSFKFLKDESSKGIDLHKGNSVNLMLWGINVLFHKSPSEILTLCEKYFGNHSLHNICITLTLLAQANPVSFEKPELKGKSVNFDRKLKRKGLPVGGIEAEKLFDDFYN